MSDRERLPRNRSPLAWGLIAVLGATAGVIPALSLLGVFRIGTRPAQPLVVVLLAVVWIAVAVARKVARPVATLALVGTAYGIVALTLRLFVSDASSEVEPTMVVVGHIVAIATYTGYGALLGAIAAVIINRRSA